LIISSTSSTTFLSLELLDGLADDLHKILFERLLFEDEAVLVPDEVGHLGIPAVLLHASLEQPEHEFVVGVLSELQLAAVVHELTELLRVTLAQLVHGHLKLLLLNVVVLFVLGASGKALPGQTAAQKVQQHVTDGLQIVSP